MNEKKILKNCIWCLRSVIYYNSLTQLYLVSQAFEGYRFSTKKKITTRSKNKHTCRPLEITNHVQVIKSKIITEIQSLKSLRPTGRVHQHTHTYKKKKKRINSPGQVRGNPHALIRIIPDAFRKSCVYTIDCITDKEESETIDPAVMCI